MTTDLPPNSESDEPARPVADLEALARHAMRLSQELEEAWSDALNQVALERGHERVNVEWGAFFIALAERMKQEERRLEAAGFDPRLYSPLADGSPLVMAS